MECSTPVHDKTPMDISSSQSASDLGEPGRDPPTPKTPGFGLRAAKDKIPEQESAAYLTQGLNSLF